MRCVRAAAVMALGSSLVWGCGTDPEPAEPGSTSSGSSSGGSTTTGGEASTGTTTGETTTAVDDGPKTCKRPCDVPATCCPADQEDCPSLAYPGNYGCADGICVLPQCMTDAECQAVSPNATCELLAGMPQCVELCDEDESRCEAGNRTCLPTVDDGRRFCRQSCTDGTIYCQPGTTCDEVTGQCLCTDDDDCPGEFRCRP